MEQQIAAQRQVTQQATVTVAGTTNIIPHQAQAVIASLAQAQQLQVKIKVYFFKSNLTYDLFFLILSHSIKLFVVFLLEFLN